MNWRGESECKVGLGPSDIQTDGGAHGDPGEGLTPAYCNQHKSPCVEFVFKAASFFPGKKG